MEQLTPKEKEDLRQKVLANKDFMADVRRSLKQWRQGGSKTIPWEDVKKELGIK